MNYRKDKEQILASIIARLKIPASRIAGVFCRFVSRCFSRRPIAGI